MKIRGKLFRLAITAMGSLAIAGGAWAQTADAPPPPPPPGVNVIYQRMGPGMVTFRGGMGFGGVEGEISDKTVTGAPFTATYSTHLTETLADGNHIVRNSTGSIDRDSQGRTRRDITVPAIGPWAAPGGAPPHVVIIKDPVAGVHYILEPERKIARKMPLPQIAGKMPLPPNGGPDGKAGPWAAFAANNEKETTTAPLGTQTIEGVTAEGTRYVRTIPAGEIGNEKPIEVITERWYSPDLQTTVMIKRSDPRMGERIFQLTNIQREEPDASLFQVPPDYTIKQGGRFFISTNGVGAPVPPPPPAPEQ